MTDAVGVKIKRVAVAVRRAFPVLERRPPANFSREAQRSPNQSALRLSSDLCDWGSSVTPYQGGSSVKIRGEIDGHLPPPLATPRNQAASLSKGRKLPASKGRAGNGHTRFLSLPRSRSTSPSPLISLPPFVNGTHTELPWRGFYLSETFRSFR